MSLSASAVIARYRHAARMRGWQQVRLRRWTGKGEERAAITSNVFGAQVTGYAAGTVAGPVEQGEGLALLICEDVAALTIVPEPDEGSPAWPGPPVKGDALVLADGRELRIVEEPDDRTRRLGDVPIAYEIRVEG